MKHKIICNGCNLGPCRNERIGKKCGCNPDIIKLKYEDIENFAKDIRALREAIFAEISPVVIPIMDWLEKWITKISRAFSGFVDYVRMSISVARACDKLEDEVAIALERLAEAKTKELEKLKEIQKGTP